MKFAYLNTLSRTIPHFWNSPVKFATVLALLLLLAGSSSRAADTRKFPPKPGSETASQRALTPEEINRLAMIDQFTKKQRDANWPALFEKAGAEFGVPSDILAGIAFGETRWEHLTWPEGETVSSENGMPHPYGIMSLWDNEYFGHSLTDAANLIGKTPDDLKKDPYQNIRGAAALLKKIYAETPMPEDTTSSDIESWRNAMAKYSGITEEDLSQGHVLQIYVQMSQGYHQYGMEWKGQPVPKLDAMRTEVNKIRAKADAEKKAKMTEWEWKQEKPPAGEAPKYHGTVPKDWSAKEAVKSKAKAKHRMIAVASQLEDDPIWMTWLVLITIPVLTLIYFALRRKDRSQKI